MPDASGNTEIDRERAYYLPPEGSALQSHWKALSPSQEKYADMCRVGGDMVANEIIKARKTGEPVSIKHLYQVAAKVRRAMAMSNPDLPDYLLYGQPNVATPTNGAIDKLYFTSGHRFNAYASQLREQFLSILKLIKSGEENFKQAFGNEYSASNRFQTIGNDGFVNRIDIFHEKFDHPVATLWHFTRSDGYTMLWLQHSIGSDQTILFNMADENFKTLHHIKNPQQFWIEMANISLALFHLTPLRRGSQTTTLMVLAGITKAMGFEVVPRSTETDHPIDAELTPYKKYIGEYQSKFIYEPRYSGPPEEVIDLKGADAFIEEADAKRQQKYAAITNPLKRINRYVRDSSDAGLGNMRITRVEVKDGKIDFDTQPTQYEQIIQHSFDFVGHDEIIHILGLEKDKEYKESWVESTKAGIKNAIARGH